MVHNVTLCVGATGAWARVSTLAVDARQVAAALAAADALWPAVWRCSDEFWPAGARRGVVDDLADRVGATG